MSHTVAVVCVFGYLSVKNGRNNTYVFSMIKRPRVDS